MVKKAWRLGAYILMAAILLCSCGYAFSIVAHGDTMFVALAVSHKGSYGKKREISAYESVFKEEGVPYKVIGITELLAYDPVKAVDSIPVIVFPDNASTWIPVDMKPWIARYVESGGSTAVIFDAGIVNLEGRYLTEALFSDLVGENYILNDRLHGKPTTKEFVKLENQKLAELFQASPYKRADSPFKGYSSEEKLNISSGEIRSSVSSKDAGSHPEVIAQKRGKGNILFVNMPLGFLKYYSGSTALSAFMRTFLFQVVKIPHLANFPYVRSNFDKENKPPEISDYSYDSMMFLDELHKQFDRLELRAENAEKNADFGAQMVKTKFSFVKQASGLKIEIENKTGLQGYYIALPIDKYEKLSGKGIVTEKDAGYYYVGFKYNIKKDEIYVNKI